MVRRRDGREQQPMMAGIFSQAVRHAQAGRTSSKHQSSSSRYVRTAAEGVRAGDRRLLAAVPCVRGCESTYLCFSVGCWMYVFSYTLIGSCEAPLYSSAMAK